MSTPWNDDNSCESDGRFPSGRWVGYWQQQEHQGRMQLDLSFSNGRLVGDGRDFVGDFVLAGTYDRTSGRCSMHKTYLAQHDVGYDGAAGGDGIRGTWHIRDPEDGRVHSVGPFHIWPIGPGESDALTTQAEEPIEVMASYDAVTELDHRSLGT